MTTDQPTPSIAIAFALTKGDKPELVVQKLTELGVDTRLLLPGFPGFLDAFPGITDVVRLRTPFRKLA